MSHYLFELFLWTTAFFVGGCIAGAALRTLYATSRAQTAGAPLRGNAATTAEVERASVGHERTETPARSVGPVASRNLSSQATGKPKRPRGIARPRGGKADRLQRISGIGPKNETVLHSLGFFHFDQIAAWTPEQMEWVDDHLRFNGRIRREKWVDQARLLAAGDEAKFRRLYGSGGTGARPANRRPASPGRRSR